MTVALRRMDRSMRWRTALLAALFLVAPVSAQAPEEDRDLVGIAEEQELLARQLKRLRQTMELLIPRLEAEGRTHALELLREGLQHIEHRGEDTRESTLEELMEAARLSLQAGQAVQSLEQQEVVIGQLLHLLSILMDRENLESLEDSIDELRDLRDRLGDLSGREGALQKETAELREQSANEAQRGLEQGLEELIARQRELLAENETLGRSSGTHALERLEAELAELLRRQSVDAEVLDSWQVALREGLESVREDLEAARQAGARARRLEETAGVLRDTARKARTAAGPEDLQPLRADLDAAADRQERHARASGEPSAEAAAEALRAAAAELRAAGSDPASQEVAAAALEERAAGLEETAAAEEAMADEARRKAAAELTATGAESSSPAAQETREALERALAGDEDREQATEEAAEALSRALQEQRSLGPALARSQEDAAQTAERLARQLGALPQAGSPSEEKAAQELQAAAKDMRSAAESAHAERSAEAAAAAREAQRALAAAQEALSGRESASEGSDGGGGQSPAAEQLAQEQRDLAEAARELEDAADDASLDETGREAVDDALDQAREAMERAADEIAAERSASAAGSQREAVQNLQRASAAARAGVRPQGAEQEAQAESLAEEQEEIRKELLELAARIEERSEGRANPNMTRATQGAGEARRSLDAGELSRAEEEEAEVQQAIEMAAQDLSEEMEQYQRLRQEELLFRIHEEVFELLQKHRLAMEATAEIDGARRENERPSRVQRMRLRQLSRDELALGERAGELGEAIREENSVVFARSLDEMQEDLERVARDLGESGGYRTGSRVQALQEDVARTCEWLLEALEEEQRRRETAPAQPQPNTPDQPENRLVPDVAELRLLRRMEVDSLERLKRLLILYPDLEQNRDVDPFLLEDVQRLAERHERTTELFSQFRSRLGIPGPDESPGETPDDEAPVEDGASEEE